MDDTTAVHGLADAVRANAGDLEADLDWFTRVLDARLKGYFGGAAAHRIRWRIAPPPLDAGRSEYARFVRESRVPPSTRLVLLLALIPHVRPQLLDVLWTRNEATQRGFTEFGGMQGANHGGFIPTGETAAFLLAGEDLAARFAMTRLFEADQFLARQNVVHLSSVAPGESALSGTLMLSREHLHRFTTGLERRPGFSAEFPARLHPHRASTGPSLVLPASTLDAARGDQALDPARREPAAGLGHARPAAAELRQPVPRRAGHRQDARRRAARPALRLRRLQARPLDDRVEVHRRDREEPGARVRPRRAQGLDPVLRRGRRAVRLAHAHLATPTTASPTRK